MKTRCIFRVCCFKRSVLLQLSLQQTDDIAEKLCFCASSVSRKQERMWAKVANRRTSASLIKRCCCVTLAKSRSITKAALRHSDLMLSRSQHDAQREERARKAIREEAHERFSSPLTDSLVWHRDSYCFLESVLFSSFYSRRFTEISFRLTEVEKLELGREERETWGDLSPSTRPLALWNAMFSLWAKIFGST